MRTFIQLKDGIGWASINTTSKIEGAIEVDSGTGDFYIKKKYDNGVWTDAELIKFAEINEDGDIVEIKRTYFSSEVDGPIMNFDTKSTHKWVDGVWVISEPIAPIEPAVIDSSQVNSE
jgi:hydrogenase maturation factor HypE